MSINYLDPQERVLWDETFDPTLCDNCGEDLINDNGHPPTCGCPQTCNPDYYHDQGR